jgi:hypothetical protein
MALPDVWSINRPKPARRLGAQDIWSRNVRPLPQRPHPGPPGSYVNWRGVEQANTPARVSPGALSPAPVRPMQAQAPLDPFLAALARDRDSQLGRIRGNFSGFTSELQGALAGLIPGFGQIYDRAEASAAATNKGVADRLGVSGEQAQTALGQKMEQINAPGTAAADLGGIYKGAAGAGYAHGAAEVDRLNAEGAAAELFASKMPFITGLEGARVAGQLMQSAEDEYRSQSTNYIKEKAQQDREERRYQEEVKREERQRLEDRKFEEAQARAAARAREKEFMMTLMADASDAQRKAAEKRLAREWEKEDKRIAREHDVEMANLRSANTGYNQEQGRIASQAQADRSREDQQAFQAEQNAKARAAAAKGKGKGGNNNDTVNTPGSAKAGRVSKELEDLVFSHNKQGQRQQRGWVTNAKSWNTVVPRINAILGQYNIKPYSPEGIRFRRAIFTKLGVATGKKGNPTVPL